MGILGIYSSLSSVLMQGVVLCHGGRIGYFQGDIRLLMDDLKTLRPTVFPVVPRLLNRMFDKVSQCPSPSRKFSDQRCHALTGPRPHVILVKSSEVLLY